MSPPSGNGTAHTEPPPYPDGSGSAYNVNGNSAQLYAPPDAEPLHTARRTPPFPEDESLEVKAIYGFSVLPFDYKAFNTPLLSMTVTDPDSKVLFHFRFNGNPLVTSMSNPSFVALVPGAQRENNPLQITPLRLWHRGAKSVKDWLWRRKCNKPGTVVSASGQSLSITRHLENGERRLDSEGKTLKRMWTEYQDGRGGHLRWSCSSFLSWTGPMRWWDEEFRLHRPDSNQVLARFTFRPTHVLTFSDSSVDQVLAIFALGDLIWEAWTAMQNRSKVSRDGTLPDESPVLFDSNLLRDHAHHVMP